MTFRYTLGYALLFGLTALLSHYDVWLTLPPASIHQWRQADGAAIAWHYAQNPDFQEVRICNLFRTGDDHAAGELPLLYWFSGLVSHYFGSPAYPLRWTGFLLLFAGGWAFGWMILQLTRRPAIAALGSGLLLTSPILAYYGPSFLPDAPAFCFVLMTAACLFQAERRQSVFWLCAAAAGAALAILLKLSMAIAPLAAGIAWGLGKRQQRWLPGTLWNGPWPVIALAGTAVIVSVFRWWIAQYNAAHHAVYFLASTRPIWNYDMSFIRETIAMVARAGLPAYASAGLYLASCAGLFLTLKHWKSTPFAYRKIMSFAVPGCAAYVLLWFRMLREHDYYVICLLIVPAMLLLNGLRLSLSRYAGKHIVYALGLCWLLGAWHNHYILSRRLYLAFHPETSENLPPAAFFRAGELKKAGIPLSARVLCPQDPSPDIALLALQRSGWTAYNFGDRITTDTLFRYHTNFGLTHLALRDTAFYSPVYRQFFPARVYTGGGWYLYAH